MAGSSALSREKIFKIAQSLPPAPKVLAGLAELLKDINVNLELVANLIKRDTALAAHLIRISNSVAYGASGEVKVGTVEDAVNRVGLREVYRLVGLAATQGLTDRLLKYYGVKTEPLRTNMLFTALVCESLAEAAKLDVRMAYTAGLMRTLGILVLDRVGDLLTGVEPYNHETFGNYATWEGRVFLFSNCEVAGMILSEWGFPAETVEAVRDHYLLHSGDYESRLACLLNVAGGIVAAEGYALPGEYGYWEMTPRKLQILNLSPRQISKANERARAAFEAFRMHIDLGALKPSDKTSEPDESADRSDDLVEGAMKAVKSASRNPWRRETPAAPQVTASVVKTPSWWRLSFTQWPLAVRTVFLFLTVALAASVTFAGAVGWPLVRSAFYALSVPLVQLGAGAAFVINLGTTLAQLIPAHCLYGVAALIATLYAALFGFGTAAYRLLVLNR